MTSWASHLIIAPILLPLVVGALLLLINDRHHSVKAAFGVGTALALVVIAVNLLMRAHGAQGAVAESYALAGWPTPFAIVLVLDRLSASMVLLTSVLGLCCVVFSLARWHRAGAHFHSLFLFLLMGLNGAFLTGDLFNLFVFFEVLLAASYGLALHGTGILRVRAGLHYIAMNLAASLLFLIGVALIYGVTGTLNMADLAARIPQVPAEDRMLLETGAAVLAIAFLAKAAMWPLGFWLTPMYAAAAAPVAAIFAIMTKVGVYAVMRVWLLFFGAGSGESALFGADWLFYGGLATLFFGGIGVLASQDLSRLAGYSVMVSSGTLLAVIGTGESAATGPALYYLISSTLALGALFLLIELAERGKVAGADILAVTMEAFGPAEGPEFDEEEEEVGVAIPAAMALLGLSFLLCALLLAGLPPVSGFIAKFAIFSSLINPAGLAAEAPAPTVAWVMLGALLASGLATIIAAARAGIRTFWTPLGRSVPRVRVIEMTPVAVLLLLCVGMTVYAGPVMTFMQDAAAALHDSAGYVEGVLPQAIVGGTGQ